MKPNRLCILLLSALWPLCVAPSASFGQGTPSEPESMIELPEVGKPLKTEGAGTRKSPVPAPTTQGRMRGGSAVGGGPAEASKEYAPKKQSYPKPKPGTDGGAKPGEPGGTTGHGESGTAK